MDDLDSVQISREEKHFLYILLGVVVLLFFFGGLMLHYRENGHLREEVAALYEGAGAPTSVGCSYHFLLVRHSFNLVTTLRFLQMTVGAVLAVIGVMLVLTGIRASYKLRIAQMSASTEPPPTKSPLRASLETSSPGLVLITLAVVTMVAALFRTSSFELETPAVCFGTMGVSPSQPAAPGPTGGDDDEEAEYVPPP